MSQASMSAAQHTPGPWSRHHQSNSIKGSPGFVGSLNDVAPADAALLIAAPELLALLVESQHSIGGDWRARRDAAIAKATGSAG